jgi:hypothetical protein
MATPTTYPSAKQVLGLAVETEQGTAVTTLAATCLVKAFEPEDKIVMLTDDALRGSMVDSYGEIQGPKNTEFSVNGPVFCDWFPFFVRNILGDNTTTGAGPYTHAMSVLNSGTAQPSSLTLVDWQGPTATSNARTYSGCCLSELTLKGNPESTLLEWSAKGLGWESSDYPTAPPTFSPSADAPMAAWRTGIGVGGTFGAMPNATIRNWEVTITRALKVEWTSQNEQTPYIIQRGVVGVTGSFYVSVPADETMLDYWLSNTQPQLQFLIDNGQAGTAQRRLTIDMLLGSFASTKINRSEEAVGYDVSFKGVANTTNAGASGGYSPIKVTTINNTASGY